MAVTSAFITILDAPGLSVSPLNRWVLIVLALPVRLSVPWAKKSAELLATLLMMLITGAPAAAKSSFSVPRLTVVVPVYTFALERVVVPVPRCSMPPLPLSAVAVKSVPWATALERLIARMPGLVITIALPAARVPVVPPLPSWRKPALIPVVPV